MASSRLIARPRPYRVFTARARIRLLKTLEYDALFLGRVPMPVSATWNATTEGACFNTG